MGIHLSNLYIIGSGPHRTKIAEFADQCAEKLLFFHIKHQDARLIGQLNKYNFVYSWWVMRVSPVGWLTLNNKIWILLKIKITKVAQIFKSPWPLHSVGMSKIDNFIVQRFRRNCQCFCENYVLICHECKVIYKYHKVLLNILKMKMW